ncbi:MAG: band 7 protein [Planctomycetales bacterium]|nr:band 7 protein [Planctomycetales bacterium]
MSIELLSDSNSPRRFPRGLTATLVGFAVAVAFVLTFLHWTVNRVYVEPGQSLLLTYKGPYIFGSHETAAKGQFATVDENGDPLQIGVLEELRGPGRHFYCPLWWKREVIDDVVVEPGEVAIISSRMGETLSGKEFLVDAELNAEKKFKGVLRKAFGPGRYRINTYAYEVKKIEAEARQDGSQIKNAGWVNIPTGYVGVVTNLADNPLTGEKAGIQQKVLQPGIYLVNPKEREIDIVEIGYREKSLAVAHKVDREGHPVFDESGEPQLADGDPGGISFPSNDGFKIYMDFTAVWGIMPDQAAEVVQKFGNVQAVEDKVVIPQVESICRNMGSKFAAVDLLVGDSRLQFQQDTSEAFGAALEDKNVTMLNGLVRYIYIPQQVRTPIQMGYIADELKLTRDQEQLTAKTEADLREAERKVELEEERTIVETAKLVAELKAEGAKEAAQTEAETVKLVAAIDKQTAAIEAQATVVLGQANADAKKLMEEARAEKFGLAVAAFGSGPAYNQWVFAQGLPEDIRLNLLYAGDGTFWTDLKGFTETLLGRQLQQQRQPAKSPAPRK